MLTKLDLHPCGDPVGYENPQCLGCARELLREACRMIIDPAYPELREADRMFMWSARTCAFLNGIRNDPAEEDR